MRACQLARDPVVSAARAFCCRNGRARLETAFCAWFRGVSDFPIESHREFQRPQRFATPDVLSKTFIQLLRFHLHRAALSLAPLCPNPDNSSPTTPPLRAF